MTIRMCLLGGISLLAATAASAQDAAPPADAGNGNKLQDIVVTAQHKAENVINVPLSIQAITGSSLSEHNIQKYDQLNFTTPGFLTQSGTGYTEAFIRGIGNNVQVGADPSVTVNIDDVPHVYGSLISDFENIERIEVLKGAQGGLYGRNTTGGVVNIITKQPSDKLEFDGKTSYGSYQTWDTSLYLNVPIISDKVDWNIAASRDVHDSYLKNKAPSAPYTGAMAFLNPGQPGQQPFSNNINNGNVWNIDSKVLIKPTSNLKITIGADYTKKNDASGNGWQSSDEGFHGTGNPLTGAASSYAQYISILPFVPVAGNQAFGDATFASDNAAQIAHIESLFTNPGKKNIYLAYLAYSPTVDYGGSVRAVWNLPGFEFTNISALRWNASRFQGDIGAAPVAMAGFQVHVTRHYFYQEDRVQTTGTGRFHFLAGGTYFHDSVNNSLADQFLGFTEAPTTEAEKTTSWSIYAQGGFDITDKLNLTASARYIHEVKTAVFGAFGGDPINPLGTPEFSGGTEHKLVPAATLSYKTDQGTIYARWARGFKTGGVNPVTRPSSYQFFNDAAGKQQICGQPHNSDGPSDPANGTTNALCVPNTTFGGETVDTYEIGYRTNLFDHKAQFTAAVFYNNYTGLQVAVGGNAANPGIALTYINAKSARTYGAEASLTVRVARPLTISGNIGYLNAKYTNFQFSGNSVVDKFNYSGNRMQSSPEWQGGMSVDLDQPINDKLNLVGSVLAAYVGSFYFSPNDVSTTRQKGYWNVNTRIGIRSADHKYGIFLDVENLFNTYYWVFGANYASGDGGVRADNVPGTPRTIKGTLELHF